jgi:Flp pilus assembly pilin Flp
MIRQLKRLWNEDEAANAVEYGLIAAVIAVALIVVFAAFREDIKAMFVKQGNVIKAQ